MLNEHGLLEYLGIEIDSIIKTDLIGMWAQIKYDERYPISKKDRVIIDEIRKSSEDVYLLKDTSLVK